jgi:hypothetical protein
MDRWNEYKPDVRSNIIWMSLFLHKQRMNPDAVRINTPWAFLPQKEFRAIVKTFGKASWDHLAYVVTAEDLKDNRRALTKKEFQTLKKNVSLETKLTFALYEIIRGHYRAMRDRAGATGMPKPPEPFRRAGLPVLGDFDGEVKDEVLAIILEEIVEDHAIDEDDEDAVIPTEEEQRAAFATLFPKETDDEIDLTVNWTTLAPAALARKNKILEGKEEFVGFKLKNSSSSAATPEEVD